MREVAGSYLLLLTLLIMFSRFLGSSCVKIKGAVLDPMPVGLVFIQVIKGNSVFQGLKGTLAKLDEELPRSSER